MYGDELCDYGMQMCLFVTIDVLGGATRIGPSTRQGQVQEERVGDFHPLLA
jgi:hypothetical protein